MIGRTNTGGGGGVGGSELVIVGGTTRPAKANHNTIWLNTPNEITSYVLSATEAETPVEGMAWVSIGDSGSVKMVSPVGGDWITVYPLSAMQYVGGAWVDVNAMSYQYGEWVEWFPAGALYWEGNERTSITGGWVAVAKKYQSSSNITTKAPTVTRYDDYIYATQTGSACGLFHIANAVDLTGYNKLIAEGEFYSTGTFAENWELSVWSNLGTYYGTNQVASTKPPLKNKTTRLEVNVSTLDGLHVIGFVMNTNGASSSDVSYAKLVKCYLE